MSRYACTALLLAGFLSACAGTAKEPEKPPPPPFRYTPDVDVSEYYPLEEGVAWTFAITGSGIAGEILSPQRVMSVNPERVIMTVGAKETSRMIFDDGITTGDGRSYLLKEPIAVGTKWSSPAGGAYSIDAVDARVTTRAGSYTDCVVVRERSVGAEVRAVYCPRVGPVVMEFWVHSPGEDPVLERKAELVSFSTKGHLSAVGESETTLEKIPSE